MSASGYNIARALRQETERMPGCIQKVMPPTDHLMTHAADEFKDAIRAMIQDDIDRRLNIDDLVSDAMKVITIPDMGDAPDAIRAALQTFLKEQVDPDAINRAVDNAIGQIVCGEVAS